MRPSRTFLFLLAIVVFLSLLSAFIDPEKWRDALFHAEGKAFAEEGNDSSVFSPAKKIHDTLTIPLVGTLPDTTESASYISSLKYWSGQAINDTVSQGGQFRILFYGDSQLEGDRMTSVMRSRLCSTQGGTGTGLFSPVMPVMYTYSFVVRSSSNWKRYTWLDFKHGLLPSNKFGPSLSLCRFTEPGVRSEKPVSAWVRVTSVPGADSAATVYDNLRILYNNLTDTVDITVYSGDIPVSKGKLSPATGVTEYRCHLSGKPDIRIEFTGRVSPDVYAMSIESNDGVVVDNIPLRGSAGLEFVMTNESNFKQSLSLLKPDLIILQFGLNVVRNVRSEYSYYEEGLVRQIEYLKKVSGNVPVLLMSVTDMAETKGDSIRYFTNIPSIRDAQKRAATRTGIVFWDAWIAMGGKGSAIEWARKTPSLVRSDLTHFSKAGADTIIVKMLADVFFPSDKKSLIDTLPLALASDSGSFLVQSHSESDADTASMHPTIIDNVKSRIEGFVSYKPDEPFIFTSPAFWIFLLIVLLGFSLVVKNKAMRNAWLFIMSLWFYYKAGGLFFILLIFTSIINYFAGLIIASSQKKQVRNLALTTSILTGIGLLGYFKYAAFFTTTVNSLFKTSFVVHDFLSAWSNTLTGTQFDVSTIILPVGISFFTFQALSYTIDIYRNKVAPVKSFIDFSFYVAFFPHLVAGPIVRASEFIPQMYNEYSLSRNEWGHALFLILQGLIKKMIISDFIAAGFIDRIFSNPELFSGFEGLLAVYGYGIQIYCDFSGYTDIAIGVALLMGFRLPVNFNSPYKSSSISDFWTRWHISLSRWLKDYLYIPLGGNRKGTLRTGFNLMFTMLVGGLWHGASLSFVVWGGLHGVGLVINKAWKWIFKNSHKGRLSEFAGIFITFHFVTFAWIFFRTSSLDQSLIMLSRIFTAFNPGSYMAVVVAYLPSLLLILTGYILHFVPSAVKESYRGVFIKMPLAFKIIALICVCIVIYKVGTEATQPFIYFRF